MSNYIMQLPDEETLKKYWGSAEAYIEEQRRTATYDLESQLQLTGLPAGVIYKSDGKTSENNKAAQKRHLPFGLRAFRHI